MVVSVNFVCDGSANNGKIQMVVDYVAPAVIVIGLINVYWGVTDPNGIEIKPFSGPDPFPTGSQDGTLTFGPNSTELLIDIPLGSDGNYVLGEYAFHLYMKDEFLGDPSEPTASYEEDFTYQFDFQTVVENTTSFGDASLAAEFNCATGEITATDSTDLTGYTLVERVLRLTPPDVPGNPAPTPVETAAAGLTETFLWNNANYQVTLSVIRSYEVEADDDWTFTVLEMLTANVTLAIVCGTAMCDAAACLSDKIATLADLACGQASWANIPQKDMNKALKPLFYGVLSLLYKECGNYNLSAANAALAGDCDCGCDDTTTSTDITPYTPPA